ncbi:hypothetical protein GCM10009814_41920 [Lapillicoccus jejuensis]
MRSLGPTPYRRSHERSVDGVVPARSATTPTGQLSSGGGAAATRGRGPPVVEEGSRGSRDVWSEAGDGVIPDAADLLLSP